MARVNAFLDLVANGKPNRAAYTTDNDLLPKNHPLATKEFASQRQWRWAFATEQPFARRWAEESTFEKLPKRKRKAEKAAPPYVQMREGSSTPSSTDVDYSAGAGERIGGQLCRDKDGQYVNCNSPDATAQSKIQLYKVETQKIRAMGREKYKEFKEQQKAKKKGGGGKGKEELTPEQEAAKKEEERVKREQEQREERERNIEKSSDTSPLGKEDAKAFAKFGDPDDPKGLSEEQTKKFEELGLVKRDKDGNLASMTREGRAYLRALRSGDKAEARDAFVDVQEAVAIRREREAEREQLKKEREQMKQEREQKKKERAQQSKRTKDSGRQDQESAIQQQIMEQAQMMAYQMLDAYQSRRRTDSGIVSAPSEEKPRDKDREKEREPTEKEREPIPSPEALREKERKEKERKEKERKEKERKREQRNNENKSLSWYNDDVFSSAIQNATFTPPKGVQRAARMALTERRNNPPSNRGMTPVGIARARDLASGRPVSLDTITRMHSYFSRHEVDKKGSTWDERGKGWQAWHGWGGDPGQRWVQRILQAAEKATNSEHLTWCIPDSSV
jgi:hypothetical protein